MLVKIENLDHNGRGIARINNKITFIENALPGEIVDINIIKEHKKYNEARVIKIIEKSKDRIAPKCPYYGECGGCEIMHMTYDSQLEFKKEKVKNILKKYADLEINPLIVSSNQDFNYRNKITLHEKNDKVGYMRENTNEIIEIEECPLVMASINDYIKEIKLKIKVQLVVRTNEKDEIISNLKNEDLIIKINNLSFYVDINSFFQVNNYICARIFETLENVLEETNTCLDLYSGVGTLSIVASKKSKKVYSIEVNPHSHKNALKNLKLNNINNIEFMCGKVEDKIKEIKENIDVIITDPPRSGMDKTTINTIKELNPKKIIYISCDPMTLARDLNSLKENYTIENIILFDMFPNTKHIETFCVLKRI